MITPHQLMSVIKEPSKIRVNSVKRSKHPKHIIVLEGEPVTYKCTVCCTIFKSKSNCCYHKHCGDEDEKPFTCPICGRKFSTRTHFSYHTLMHSGLNPHKCSICEKSFKTKYKLRRHQQVHTDTQKRFFCDICGRAFLRKSSILVHKQVHTGVKPYQCNECPKAFREKKNLIFHRSRHTGIKNFVCEICGKSYALKRDLELHKRTHTRIRPFSCTVSKCQQTFSQRRYLKRHMETHESCMKFICNICDKEFSRKDNLQRHIVNTHLESQNLDASQDEKTKHIPLDTAPYIKTVKTRDATNESDELVSIEQKLPPVRTESVIMSTSNTNIVISVNSRQEENHCNRISVIRTLTDILSEADKENDAESEDLVHDDHIKCLDYQARFNSSDEFPSENSCFKSPKTVLQRDRGSDEEFEVSKDSNVNHELNYKDIPQRNFVSQPFCSMMNNENDTIHVEPITRLYANTEQPYDDETCCRLISVISSRYDVHDSVSTDGLDFEGRKSTRLFYDNEGNVHDSMDLESLNLANRPLESNVCAKENQQTVTCCDSKHSEDIFFDRRISVGNTSSNSQWTVYDSTEGDCSSQAKKLVEPKTGKQLTNRDSRSFGEISPIIDIDPLSYHEIVRTVPHFDCSHFLRVEENEQGERSHLSLHHDLADCLGADRNSSLKSAKNESTHPNKGICASNSPGISNPVCENKVSGVASHVVPHFAPERITTEVVKTRCMLPKKVIAASYRNCIAHEIKDSYKLLDLSMKSQ